MKLHHILTFLLVASALVVASCSTLKNSQKGQRVPYTVAQRYFLKNDVTSLPNGAITSASEFERLFGMATVMGKDGQPTTVDFTRQFVIAVSVPETNRATDIKPLTLQQENGSLVLSYTVERGEQRSFSIQPLLLLVVDKKYEATVELRETGTKQ